MSVRESLDVKRTLRAVGFLGLSACSPVRLRRGMMVEEGSFCICPSGIIIDLEHSKLHLS